MEKAEDDFKAAKTLLDSGQNAPRGAICFHIQQCVEKYLKACLAQNNVDFGKTHDIGELVLRLPKFLEFPLTPREQDELTYYAVEARYPGVPGHDEDAPTLKELFALAQMMKRARNKIREVLGLTE